MPIKTLSCFAGIEGMATAAIAVGGFDFTDAIEIHPFRQQVLKARFPDLKLHEDIRNYHAKPREFDCIVSTFPCKGTSDAGSRKGLKEPRSALWWESLRVILECRASIIVIENVEGFITRGLRECLVQLGMAGYQTDDPILLSAKECGALHKRNRLFVCAYANRIVESCGGKLPPSWTGQIGEQVKRAVQHSERVQLSSRDQRVVDGFPDRVDRFVGRGYWSRAFTGATITEQYKLPNRFDRIAALGDSCTPQQAAIALERIRYLDQWFRDNQDTKSVYHGRQTTKSST